MNRGKVKTIYKQLDALFAIHHSLTLRAKFGDTDYYRMVLNKENLNYIFSRIKLLS